ncbi:unnamed protein product, partial [Iphiclides podalirius]
MSTGKRLAKRSIIGTRVAALGDDGLYYSGMIQAVKTPAPFPENNNCINLTPNTRYTVRFDGGKVSREYRDAELIGPGFRGLTGVRLQPGQRVFLTHNGREVRADVLCHDHETDELRVQVHLPAAEIDRILKPDVYRRRLSRRYDSNARFLLRKSGRFGPVICQAKRCKNKLRVRGRGIRPRRGRQPRNSVTVFITKSRRELFSRAPGEPLLDGAHGELG